LLVYAPSEGVFQESLDVLDVGLFEKSLIGPLQLGLELEVLTRCLLGDLSGGNENHGFKNFKFVFYVESLPLHEFFGLSYPALLIPVMLASRKVRFVEKLHQVRPHASEYLFVQSVFLQAAPNLHLVFFLTYFRRLLSLKQFSFFFFFILAFCLFLHLPLFVF